jgi:putative transcriptional regulator
MSTKITRHPDAATLMGFAAGGLPEPLAAAVSAHASICSDCREEVRDMELIGAAVLVGLSPAPGATGGEVAAPHRPQEPAQPGRNPPGGSAVPGMPAPLARKYGLALDSIPWKLLAPGVWEHCLALSQGAEGDLRLIKLAPGRKLPRHGHGVSELTLVLAGAFSDASGDYRCGDVQDLESGNEHQPVGDKEVGCICLVASVGSYYFTSK